MSPFLRAILAIGLLTLMDGVIKEAMLHHPFVQAVCLRFAAGGAIALAVLAAVRPPPPDRASLKANLVRVPLVVVTASSFFFSIKELPMAEALALAFIAPVLVALLGALILKERLDRKIGVALAFGFAGMLVMVSPRLTGQAPASALGVAAALVSALTYAMNLILLRKLALREHPAIIVAFQNGGPALLLAIPTLFVWVSPTPGQWLLYLLAGALGVSGHLLLTSAFARAEASRIAPIEYTGLVWAALVGYVGFGEIPYAVTWFGAALIIMGSLTVSRR